jgi:hypothetical protein
VLQTETALSFFRGIKTEQYSTNAFGIGQVVDKSKRGWRKKAALVRDSGGGNRVSSTWLGYAVNCSIY